MTINENTPLQELFTTSKALGFMRANMNMEAAQPNDPMWDEYNKYREMQDRIDDIIQGKIEQLEVICPPDWVGKSE